MSPRMREIYNSVDAEAAVCDVGILSDTSDDGIEVLDYLIFHGGRVMLKTEYEATHVA